ncbi:50S ribosomal protein L13 [Polystyrenella longa]|uniref:Large ribosomal subunit protein uL13 n=1 Tax=Polystyrenella longa TaxID=2528007 RepID=A0A518CJT7_9PLAN|nr:50S ribosomal protein L13 [Polystyrenella longa]QDU79480.1 50S ribosomal protein L13 [Polystyrenella longa]
MSKTTIEKNETFKPSWYTVDADNQIVGRLASKLAMVLMGKHKPVYTPHVDTGDYVIVLNAHLVRFSGRELAHNEHPYLTEKMMKKEYDSYSGFPGGRKVQTGLQVWQRHPEKILHEAVRRMLPKNKLGVKMLKKLKLVCGNEHGYQAQQPVELPGHLLPK